MTYQKGEGGLIGELWLLAADASTPFGEGGIPPKEGGVDARETLALVVGPRTVRQDERQPASTTPGVPLWALLQPLGPGPAAFANPDTSLTFTAFADRRPVAPEVPAIQALGG